MSSRRREGGCDGDGSAYMSSDGGLRSDFVQYHAPHAPRRRSLYADGNMQGPNVLHMDAGAPPGFVMHQYHTTAASAAGSPRPSHHHGSGHPARNGTRLFVGGLNYTTTEIILEEYFSRFGGVVSAHVMRDATTRVSRGFAFVNFASPAAAANACSLSFHMVDGKQVQTKYAVPKSTATQSASRSVSNLSARRPSQHWPATPMHPQPPQQGFGASAAVPPAPPMQMFQPPPKNTNYQHPRTAVQGVAASPNSRIGLRSAGLEAAAAAQAAAAAATVAAAAAAATVSSASEAQVGGARRPRRVSSQPRATSTRRTLNTAQRPDLEQAPHGGVIPNKLFVGGLRYTTPQAALNDYFVRFGIIESAEIVFNRDSKKSRGFGFVLFRDSASTQRVLDCSPHVIDGKEIEVKACEVNPGPRRVSKQQQHSIETGIGGKDELSKNEKAGREMTTQLSWDSAAGTALQAGEHSPAQRSQGKSQLYRHQVHAPSLPSHYRHLDHVHHHHHGSGVGYQHVHQPQQQQQQQRQRQIEGASSLVPQSPRTGSGGYAIPPFSSEGVDGMKNRMTGLPPLPPGSQSHLQHQHFGYGSHMAAVESGFQRSQEEENRRGDAASEVLRDRGVDKQGGTNSTLDSSSTASITSGASQTGGGLDRDDALATSAKFARGQRRLPPWCVTWPQNAQGLNLAAARAGDGDGSQGWDLTPPLTNRRIELPKSDKDGDKLWSAPTGDTNAAHDNNSRGWDLTPPLTNRRVGFPKPDRDGDKVWSALTGDTNVAHRDVSNRAAETGGNAGRVDVGGGTNFAESRLSSDSGSYLWNTHENLSLEQEIKRFSNLERTRMEIAAAQRRYPEFFHINEKAANIIAANKLRIERAEHFGLVVAGTTNSRRTLRPDAIGKEGRISTSINPQGDNGHQQAEVMSAAEQLVQATVAAEEALRRFEAQERQNRVKDGKSDDWGLPF